jgi:scyllo-inositol 2-dehydrogenase (NADP+)
VQRGLESRVEAADPAVAAAVRLLVDRLRSCGFDPTATGPGDALLVWSDAALAGATVEDLLAAAGRGVAVLLLGPTLARQPVDSPLVAASGLMPGVETPPHEIRLRPGPHATDADVRSDDDVILTDRWTQVRGLEPDVEQLLTAMAGLNEHVVMSWRPATHVGVCSVGETVATFGDPAYQRLVHRWVRRALGVPAAPPVRVGLLGYGAIGPEHADGCASVPGLELVAVCDRSQARLTAALTRSPELRSTDDADALLGMDDVDLVIVSTPPNTHADWSLRALEAGKHVVVEKPFSITTVEADKVIAAAADAGRIATVYQNRRWDPDYLALKRVVRSGRIGEVFHYESFVGGYGHPCNYWHSDEDVSGGAIYDWGSHYLDWVLDLLPETVEQVSATTHKRVWHDVTNADHSRVTVRFADGVEAEFVHSDLAAAMKPKWYVLGTAGAIVGSWRSERVVSRNAVGTLVEDRLAAADAPADLTVHDADGSVTALALPPAPRHPFHRELVDLLGFGEPMSVDATSSRRNIAVMEAAVASARDGGRPTRPS